MRNVLVFSAIAILSFGCTQNFEDYRPGNGGAGHGGANGGGGNPQIGGGGNPQMGGGGGTGGGGAPACEGAAPGDCALSLIHK
jgi:hypothetical protein